MLQLIKQQRRQQQQLQVNKFIMPILVNSDGVKNVELYLHSLIRLHVVVPIKHRASFTSALHTLIR